MLDQFDPKLDGAFAPPDTERLIARLRAILPADGLIIAKEGLAPYECDALAAYRGLPKLVALPRTGDEVRAVLALCHALNVPIVARGAGTGLSGGALPFPGSVMLVLTRLDRILELDPEAMTARVQPCATWPFQRPPRRTAFFTPPIRPASSPAASSALWR